MRVRCDSGQPGPIRSGLTYLDGSGALSESESAGAGMSGFWALYEPVSGGANTAPQALDP